MKGSVLTLQRGFTLIELMVAVAIIAILTAIAIPVYQGYIATSQVGAEKSNAQSLRVYLEDYQLNNGTYVVSGTTPPYTQIGSTGQITAAYGWQPTGDQSKYSYTVSPTSTSWSVVVQPASGSGTWVRCDDRASKCCSSASTGSSTPVSACP